MVKLGGVGREVEERWRIVLEVGPVIVADGNKKEAKKDKSVHLLASLCISLAGQHCRRWVSSPASAFWRWYSDGTIWIDWLVEVVQSVDWWEDWHHWATLKIAIQGCYTTIFQLTFSFPCLHSIQSFSPYPIQLSHYKDKTKVVNGTW